jgi:pimeloyl-ACP methyl ester carboxylesterase
MKIIIQNIVTEYEDVGDGPIILLLHGWKSSLHSFDGIKPFLLGKFRLISLDMPGFGKTGMPDIPWSIIDYVNFIKDFIAKLNIGDHVVVGHSFGGRVILKGEATKQLNPEKIILIASAGVAKRRNFRNIIFKAIAKVGNIVTLLPPFLFFRKELKMALYRKSGSDYLNAGVLRETFLKTIEEDLSSSAKGIYLPTLIIWGASDKTTPLSEGKLLSGLIQGSTLKVLDDAGHFVHEEKPEQVAGLIEKFL